LAAAWKFLAVDLAGSGLLLLAILILYFKAPLRTFDIVALHDLVLPTAMATLVAWLFFIAFAVKLPVFPFHTWFIDAQAEASPPGCSCCWWRPSWSAPARAPSAPWAGWPGGWGRGRSCGSPPRWPPSGSRASPGSSASC